jgi:hypothetical protein
MPSAADGKIRRAPGRLLAHSGLFQPPRRMSAFRSKADAFSRSPICPLMALSGHHPRGVQTPTGEDGPSVLFIRTAEH